MDPTVTGELLEYLTDNLLRAYWQAPDKFKKSLIKSHQPELPRSFNDTKSTAVVSLQRDYTISDLVAYQGGAHTELKKLRHLRQPSMDPVN